MDSADERSGAPMDQFWQDVVSNLESVQFWLGVLVGAIVGAVLGVVADRLWGRVEQRPKVKISVGSYENVNGQNGFNLQITNIGRAPLPAFRPWLVSSTIGRYTMFFLEKSDNPPREWLVGQTAVFVGPIFLHNKPQDIPKQIATYAEQNHQFAFQLVMENSQVALYKNKRMGRAFVRAIQESLAVKLGQKPYTTTGGWGNTMDMMTVHGIWPRIKRIYQRIWWAWFIRFGQHRRKGTTNGDGSNPAIDNKLE